MSVDGKSCQKNVTQNMDTIPKRSWKENPIVKTWNRIKSIGHKTSGKNKTAYPPSSSAAATATFTKSKSWHSTVPPISVLHDDYEDNNNNSGGAGAAGKQENKKKTQSKTVVAPEGCLTVYVGAKKQRFVVRTELVNHPMFKILLEDAETEFGYRSEGPIVLPCEIDFFFKVLAEIDSCEDDDDWANPPVCGLCSPYRHGGASTDSGVMRRYSSYKVLRTPPVFKLNRF